MMSANELRGWFCSILAVLASMIGLKHMVLIFATVGTLAFVLDLIQDWRRRHVAE